MGGSEEAKRACDRSGGQAAGERRAVSRSSSRVSAISLEALRVPRPEPAENDRPALSDALPAGSMGRISDSSGSSRDEGLIAAVHTPRAEAPPPSPLPAPPQHLKVRSCLPQGKRRTRMTLLYQSADCLAAREVAVAFNGSSPVLWAYCRACLDNSGPRSWNPISKGVHLNPSGLF